MQVFHYFLASLLVLSNISAEEQSFSFVWELAKVCYKYDFFVGSCHPCTISECPTPSIKANMYCQLFKCHPDYKSTTPLPSTTTTTTTTTTPSPTMNNLEMLAKYFSNNKHKKYLLFMPLHKKSKKGHLM